MEAMHCANSSRSTKQMSNEEIKVEVETEETPKKKGNIISIICVLIGVICIGVAGYGLYGIYADYKVGDDIYKEVESEFVQIHIPVEDTEVESTEVDSSSTEMQNTPEGPRGPWYELASVDIAGLKKQYPDVVGWILFENGMISYPVMHSHSNDTYLYTAYNGTESIGGSIFVEAVHSGDFSDTHTLIYGHNMKNGSMFGKLHYYRRSNDYYEGGQSRQYFLIYTEEEILRYHIFAYQEVNIESFVFKEYFTSAKELGNRLLANSRIRPEVNIPEDGKIITLSTCTAGEENRFVVSAVLVARYNLADKTIIEE